MALTFPASSNNLLFRRLHFPKIIIKTYTEVKGCLRLMLKIRIIKTITTKSIITDGFADDKSIDNTLYFTPKDTGYYYIEGWTYQYREVDKLDTAYTFKINKLPVMLNFKFSGETYRVEIIHANSTGIHKTRIFFQSPINGGSVL